MARTKQTARRSTGTVKPNHSHPMQTEPRPCIQASSSDPPIIDTELSPAVQAVLAQYADEELTREAMNRYDDEVVPNLTGRSSRKRKADCIAVLKKQILMEREYATAQVLSNLAPTEPEPEPVAQVTQAIATEPVIPVTQATAADPVHVNKRNRGPLKTEGGVSYNKPHPKTANPGSWTASYHCFRKSGFPTKPQAQAKLSYWKDNDLCPCCEKPNVITDGIPQNEYRFRSSDPAADLIVIVNGKEYRIPGGGEYVVKF